MKKKYNDIEKGILKINYMYKSAIDKYYDLENKKLYSGYSENENDALIILYYNTLRKVFEECERINDFENFEDIVSSVTIKIVEYIADKNNSDFIISEYIDVVMDKYVLDKSKSDLFVSIKDCKDEKDNIDLENQYLKTKLFDAIRKVANNRISERDREILEDYIIYNEKKAHISKKYNISNTRVTQIINNSLRKLRVIEILKFDPVHNQSTYKQDINFNNIYNRSTGLMLSKGSVKEFNDCNILKKYIHYIEHLHCINYTGKKFLGTDFCNRDLLIDSFLIGRLYSCDFSGEKSSGQLLNFYNNIKSIPGLINFYNIFIDFINYYYEETEYFKSLDDNHKDDIMSILFYMFHISVENSILKGSACTGYNTYYYYEKYYNDSIEKCFIKNTNINKFSIVDFIIKYMKIYKTSMIEFGKLFYKFSDILFSKLIYDKYFDKYDTFKYIECDTNNLANYKDILNISNYATILYDSIYKHKLGLIDRDIILSILQILIDNYIINKDEAYDILYRRNILNEF